MKGRRITQPSKEQMVPAVATQAKGQLLRAGGQSQHVLVEGIALVVSRVRGSFT